MNADLQSIQDRAPDFVRQQRRRDFVFYVFYAVALIALGGAIYGTVVNWNQGDQITRIEKSACADAQAHPRDKKSVRECQQIRAAAEQTANEHVTCIPLTRAGYECPKPGSPLAAERRSREAREVAGGGDAISTGTSGHSQSGRHEGGSHGTDSPSHPHTPSVPHQSSGGGEASAPSSPPSSSATGASSSSTTERVETVEPSPATEAPKAPVREAVGGLVEGVSGSVEETTHAVDGTVEGVMEPVCSLTKLLCP